MTKFINIFDLKYGPNDNSEFARIITIGQIMYL